MASKGLGLGAIGFGQLGGAVIPGGNLKPTPYAPVAVEFFPHASIFQSPTAIPDSSAFTLSLWLWLPAGSSDYEFFTFGGGGGSLFRNVGNATLTGLEFFLVEGRTAAQINEFPSCFLTGQWNHIFTAYRPSTGNTLWINGKFIANIPDSSGVSSLSVSGTAVEFPNPFGTGGALYSDLQCWFSTYIDPTGTYVGGSVPVVPQPPIGGNPASPTATSIIGQIISGLPAVGMSGQYGLTVADIESSYGTTPPGSKSPIFSFTQAEMDFAIPPPTGKHTPFTNTNEINAFIFYNTVPGSNSWLQPSWQGADPTGYNRYLTFNQGNSGAQTILNASAGTTINQLQAATPSQPNLKSNMLGQSWANGGNDNVWGGYDSDFKTALDGNSTIGQWLARFNAVYTDFAANDAAGRITGASVPNINAFIDPYGRAVPPGVAAGVFGQQSLLFTGKAATYATNLGNGGVFSFQGTALVDYPLPPP